MTDAFAMEPCPVCGSTEHIRLYSFEYWSDGVLRALGLTAPVEGPALYRCSICNHHFANPQIRQELLDLYYFRLGSEFFDAVEGAGDYLGRRNSRLVEQIETYVARGRVLEVGCGLGYFLAHFDPERWERHGIDPAERACAFARTLGLNVVHALGGEQSYSAPFDVVLMFDVIEHLKRPGEMVNWIRGQLRDAGLLVIGTGNVASINARLAGRYWGYFGSWEHVSLFSPESVTYLLELHSFAVERIDRVSHRGSGLAGDFRAVLTNLEVGMKNAVKATLNLLPLRSRYRLGHASLVRDHLVVFARAA